MKESVDASAEERREDKDMYNRIFDLVLNMNSTSKAKAGSSLKSNTREMMMCDSAMPRCAARR